MTPSHFGHHPIDDEARRKWQNPEAILRKIGLHPGDIFMDIGCGEGFFTIPAAKIVGNKGTVYGLDINPQSIENLRTTVINLGLSNIKLSIGEAEKTILCKSCADIVFFGIDLHDFDDPVAVLNNARRMIKPEGKLADLDFKKIRMAFGPPYEKRLDEAKAQNMIESAGFAIESVADIPPYCYLIFARPV